MYKNLAVGKKLNFGMLNNLWYEIDDMHGLIRHLLLIFNITTKLRKTIFLIKITKIYFKIKILTK